jgi:hypothetical protein
MQGDCAGGWVWLARDGRAEGKWSSAKKKKAGTAQSHGRTPLLIYGFLSRSLRKSLLGFNLRGAWGFRRGTWGSLGGVGRGGVGGLGFAAAAAKNQKGHRQNQGGQEVLLHRSNSLKSQWTWAGRTAVATGRAAESTDQTFTKLDEQGLNIKPFPKNQKSIRHVWQPWAALNPHLSTGFDHESSSQERPDLLRFIKWIKPANMPL